MFSCPLNSFCLLFICNLCPLILLTCPYFILPLRRSATNNCHFSTSGCLPKGNYSCEQRSTDQYKIYPNQQSGSHILPEIQTKSISLSASAPISILLRSESEGAKKRCTRSAPTTQQLSDKLVCSSHVLPSKRERALNMIGRNT